MDADSGAPFELKPALPTYIIVSLAGSVPALVWLAVWLAHPSWEAIKAILVCGSIAAIACALLYSYKVELCEGRIVLKRWFAYRRDIALRDVARFDIKSGGLVPPYHRFEIKLKHAKEPLAVNIRPFRLKDVQAFEQLVKRGLSRT